MAIIEDSSGQKLATMGDDNKVRNLQGIVIGSVSNNGEVWNTDHKIGHVDGKGYVYEGGNQIGNVHPDGRVFDYKNHYVGKIVDGHVESGGAALLLLVR